MSPDLIIRIIECVIAFAAFIVSIKGYYTQSQKDELSDAKTRLALLEQRQDEHTKGLDKLDKKLDDLWRDYD